MSKGNEKGEEGETAPLQAVLVADPFHEKFAAAVPDAPFALFPLVGVPMIDYALESLAQAGVDETFLFCSSHVDSIKSHVRRAKEEKASWSVRMTLRIIVSENCHSFGDALRDLDAKGFIRGYFVLASVDGISNVKLLPLLEKHKDICKKDKGAVMTLVYKSAFPGHRSQNTGENVLLIANSKNNRVLYHRKLTTNNRSKIIIPTEIFLHNTDVKVHSNLIDTNISICSPDVLPLFADNFDFQSKNDFIKGILMNEEILSNTIYYHLLQGDQYAASITNWQMYQTISQDIMNRLVFPFAPDMGIFKQHKNFVILRNHVYRQESAKLAKGCELKKDVVIFEKSSIGENVIIERSVIGKKCIIGSNCTIYDSFLMDDCVINNDCHIKASLLSSNCVMKQKVCLDQVILGSSVELEENKNLKDSIIQCYATENETTKIGEKAYLLIQSNVGEDSSSDISDDVHTEGFEYLKSKWWDEQSETDSSSSDEESSEHNTFVPEDENLFRQEVIDSLTRGYIEKLECDCLILEINSSRYAYNMSLQEVNYNVILALLSIVQTNSADTNMSIIKCFEEVVKIFAPIISNYIKGLDAMVDCLKAIEDCSIDPQMIKNVAKIIHYLYEKDVITESAILHWHEDLVEEKRLLRENIAVTKLIDWLKEASEESDDSE